MKKTQNGTTPATSEGEASAVSDGMVRYMAIEMAKDVNEWKVVEGYAHEGNIANIVFNAYPPAKGWEVSFYKEVEGENTKG